ncbi:hypothetical protein ACI65C_007006 [Semiaphis heraclei]
MQRNNSDTIKLKNKPKLSPVIITKTISHKTQDATSPSATSDNDQDWNAVDNNKRIRSPNNTTSPRTKKTNEPSNFLSPNRYSLLDIDEINMDLDTNTEVNESPPPPPPIFLTSPINFITLCKNLEKITKTEGFLCKSNSKKNFDTPQVQPNSQVQSNNQPPPGAPHLINAPTRSLNEPSDTQHLSFSQAVKGLFAQIL